MNQRRKNIRLLIILGILLLLTLAVALTGTRKNRIDVPTDLFSYSQTEDIDQVVLGQDTLSYRDRQWIINGRYKADPQRVEVLFAIIQQVKVRRGAAKVKEDSLRSAMKQGGVAVRLYAGGKLQDSFRVLGEEDRGITWMQKEEGADVYLVEIPGYRSYLGGIFHLDGNGWRYPMVYDLNWKNFQSSRAEYPEEPENSFRVTFGKNSVEVQGLEETDTARLNDYLNDLSLLYVNDYLYPREVRSYDSLTRHITARIVVTDVGNNEYTMEVLDRPPGTRDMLVRIDSSDYALVDYKKIKKLLKPRWFFRKQ